MCAQVDCAEEVHRIASSFLAHHKRRAEKAQSSSPSKAATTSASVELLVRLALPPPRLEEGNGKRETSIPGPTASCYEAREEKGRASPVNASLVPLTGGWTAGRGGGDKGSSGVVEGQPDGSYKPPAEAEAGTCPPPSPAPGPEIQWGAGLDKVASIVRAAAAAAQEGIALSVVGFSVDVGASCLMAAASLAPEPGVDATGAGTLPITGGNISPPPSLLAGMKTAVSHVLVAAQRASRAAQGFSFSHLHVAGLGVGGTHKEPLGALGTALLGLTDSKGRLSVSADATEYLVGGVCSLATSIIGKKSVPAPMASDDLPGAGGEAAAVRTSMVAEVTGLGDSVSESVAAEPSTPTPAIEAEIPRGAEAAAGQGQELREGAGAGAGSGTEGKTGRRSPLKNMYYVDDGCYGSLSGVVLRGAEMSLCALRTGHVEGKVEEAGVGDASPALNPASPTRMSTVWGPTCDGLDCVAQVADLPSGLRPGRDWLFFGDTAMRMAADTTGFNGLVPPDTLYCLRQQQQQQAGWGS
ncbi:unnamed protein product [Discosporangium mesarthrocarpum]